MKVYSVKTGKVNNGAFEAKNKAQLIKKLSKLKGYDVKKTKIKYIGISKG